MTEKQRDKIAEEAVLAIKAVFKRRGIKLPAEDICLDQLKDVVSEMLRTELEPDDDE